MEWNQCPKEEWDQPPETMNYLNTEMFLKRDGIWKVVAWQATRVPEEIKSNQSHSKSSSPIGRHCGGNSISRQ